MTIKLKNNILIGVLLFFSLSNAASVSCLYHYGVRYAKSFDNMGLRIENNEIRLPEYMLSSDPYTVLGIKKEDNESNADFDIRLKKRFRKLSMSFHSDRSELVLDSLFSSDSSKNLNRVRVQELLDQGFKIIKESYELISSSEKREANKSGFSTEGYGDRGSSDPFDGYFSKGNVTSYAHIIMLELNKRAMNLGNMRPIIDTFRELRSLGSYNRAQLLNSSYRIGFFKTAIKKAHKYLTKSEAKNFSEEDFQKAIEYFIFNHLGILSHKFSFKDYLDLYVYVNHPKAKLALTLAATKNHADDQVKFSMLSHFIADMSSKNESLFRLLNAKEIITLSGSKFTFENNLKDFLTIWLTDVPVFLKQTKGSMDDVAVLKFLDLADLEPKDLPMDMLSKLANGPLDTRSRSLARKILNWNESATEAIIQNRK